MTDWIAWEDIRGEIMKTPGVSERYEAGFEDFKKRMAAEIAAEKTRRPLIKPRIASSRPHRVSEKQKIAVKA